MRKSFLLVIAFLTLTLCPLNSKADTVSLSGFANFHGFSGFFDLSFGGMNSDGTSFGIQGHGSTIAGIHLPLFRANESAGTQINLGGSAFLLGADFSGGSVMINGASYAINTVDLLITAPSVTIPFSSDSVLVFAAPCTVTGGLSGKSVGTNVGAGFSGSCIATFTMAKTGTDISGNGLYTSQSIIYSFHALPTPEPATIVLLGTGLVGIGSVALRRRSKNAK